MRDNEFKENGVNGVKVNGSLPHSPELWITGLGSQYPVHLQTPEKLSKFAARFHDTERPVLKKLLKLCHHNGINTRPSVTSFENGFGCQQELPSVADIDNTFGKYGADLTAQACRKALREWGGDASKEITHTVSVNSGIQTFPGFDFQVARQVGLDLNTEQILLQGVGCAGGMSIVRVAAQIAMAAEAQNKPARILCFSCELNTLYFRHWFSEAEACDDEANMDIGAAIFSDGAAAFVLCNRLGLDDEENAKLQLIDWDRMVAPDTVHKLTAFLKPTGYTCAISKEVPDIAKGTVPPLFEKCSGRFRERTGLHDVRVQDFDFAIHPGGQRIIDKIQKEMDLTEKQMKPTRQIYETRGNSGSAAVLCVLDLLSKIEDGSDNVAAVSFGPGVSAEMALFRRCRDD